MALLVCQGLAPATIKTYLAGVRHAQIMRGFEESRHPPSSSPVTCWSEEGAFPAGQPLLKTVFTHSAESFAGDQNGLGHVTCPGCPDVVGSHVLWVGHFS